jgi:hypothetical protein
VGYEIGDSGEALMIANSGRVLSVLVLVLFLVTIPSGASAVEITSSALDGYCKGCNSTESLNDFSQCILDNVKNREEKAAIDVSSVAESIDMDVLAEAMGEAINRLKKLGMEKAIKRGIGKDFPPDFAMNDALMAVSNELMVGETRSLSAENLTKAFIRYALTQAIAEMLPDKAVKPAINDYDSISSKVCNGEMEASEDCKNTRDMVKRFKRSVVYAGLANISSSDSFHDLKGGNVKYLSDLGFTIRDASEFKCAENKCKVGGIYIDTTKINEIVETLQGKYKKFFELAILYHRYKEDKENLACFASQLKQEQIKEYITAIVVGSGTLNVDELSKAEKLLTTALPLALDLYNANKEGNLDDIMDTSRSLVYSAVDRVVGDECTSVEDADLYKKKCLPSLAAHTVLDNIACDNDKCTFYSGKAIESLASNAGKFGGESTFFYHLVIGYGTGFRMDKKEGESSAIPLVWEQVGGGVRLKNLTAVKWIDSVVNKLCLHSCDTKLGFFASGLLYRAVYDNEESDGVFVGPFFAMDILDTIQLNASYYWNVVGDDTRHGPALSIFIPLDNYLSKLAAKTTSSQ